MSLFETYKTESFPNQYYEISKVPFVLMGIEPYSKLADDLISNKYGSSYNFLIWNCPSYDEKMWKGINARTAAMQYIERDCTRNNTNAISEWVSSHSKMEPPDYKYYRYNLSESEIAKYKTELNESISNEISRIKAEIEVIYPGLSVYLVNMDNEQAILNKELLMLRVAFKRINHEISHNDLIIKHAVNDYVPTDKILAYKKQQTKPITSEPEELKESERNSLLKLVLGMAIDGYRYDPYKTKNTSTGGKNGSIQAALNRCGLELDQKTINRYLTEANKKYPAKP
ncbi:hypothetical protein [Methylobacter psychrophilus]|uniref:hypothetical protein n=1 Tax=Methylobacter psychrophilus TaxID=96941 RepID=UPI0021D4B8C2|nr:hypothetical protein [Methylobacter psychrophilus]